MTRCNDETARNVNLPQRCGFRNADESRPLNRSRWNPNKEKQSGRSALPDRTIGIFFGIFFGGFSGIYWDFLGFLGFFGIFRVFGIFFGIFFLLVDGTVEVKERLVAVVVKTAVIGRSLERC